MYQELDPAKTTALVLLRKGWWGPEYTLTDNATNYGVLSYANISKRTAFVVTAIAKLKINFETLFDRTISITDEKNVVVGEYAREFFSRRGTLTLNSGFSADFYRPSFFSREYVWESGGYGKIMTIQNNFPFTLTTDIQLYPTKTPATVIPLLIFLGAHLIILKRRKRAVH
jgi:hypothetical protein